MQLFPIGKVYDFMGQRRTFVGLSVLMVVASIVLLFQPGPRLGTDFVGGTEVEVAFNQAVSPTEIRRAVSEAGFTSPDVIRVKDTQTKNQFLIRVKEVSTITDADQAKIEKLLCLGQEGCEHEVTEVTFSPGGEQIALRFESEPDLAWVAEQLKKTDAVQVRPGENNPVLQDAQDRRVEVALMSKGDQLMTALSDNLPLGAVPERALRMEWIGPKAGAQLRDAAIKSVLIALVFIMAYVAFRFDLRFAPGGVIALVHDAIVTIGVLILLKKELNLTTVAAVLTIIGYSVNDTVVVYDRVRENLGKLRGTGFQRLINISLSEMLSRTVLTSGTTILVLTCFFIWGTGTLKDFALTMIVGMVLGTYSSIYVALPVTDFLDRRFFADAKKRVAPKGHVQPAR